MDTEQKVRAGNLSRGSQTCPVKPFMPHGDVTFSCAQASLREVQTSEGEGWICSLLPNSDAEAPGLTRAGGGCILAEAATSSSLRL